MLLKRTTTSVVLLIFTICVIWTNSVSALEGSVEQNQNLQSLFYQANAFYESLDYQKAVDAYEQILSQGYTSGAVFYNLGNSYYRLGEKGYALANYLRAKQYIPRDPDLRSNLDYLLKEMNIELDNQGFFTYITNYLTFNELTGVLTGVFAVLTLLILLAVYRPNLRRLFRIPTIVSGVAFGILLLGVGVGLIQSYSSNPAIAVAREAVVRFEPSVNGEVHYRLSQGSSLEIESSRDGWLSVRRADGKKGWVQSDEVLPLKYNDMDE